MKNKIAWALSLSILIGCAPDRDVIIFDNQDGDAVPPNVAIGKPSTMSGDYSNSFCSANGNGTADIANDGILCPQPEEQFTCDNVAITSHSSTTANNTAWWEVDLLTMHKIYVVFVHAAAWGNQRALALQIRNDVTEEWRSLSFNGISTGREWTMISVYMAGRYVRILRPSAQECLNGGDDATCTLQLCEVEVFGKPYTNPNPEGP